MGGRLPENIILFGSMVDITEADYLIEFRFWPV